MPHEIFAEDILNPKFLSRRNIPGRITSRGTFSYPLYYWADAHFERGLIQFRADQPTDPVNAEQLNKAIQQFALNDFKFRMVESAQTFIYLFSPYRTGDLLRSYTVIPRQRALFAESDIRYAQYNREFLHQVELSLRLSAQSHRAQVIEEHNDRLFDTFEEYREGVDERFLRPFIRIREVIL